MRAGNPMLSALCFNSQFTPVHPDMPKYKLFSLSYFEYGMFQAHKTGFIYPKTTNNFAHHLISKKFK